MCPNNWGRRVSAQLRAWLDANPAEKAALDRAVATNCPNPVGRKSETAYQMAKLLRKRAAEILTPEDIAEDRAFEHWRAANRRPGVYSTNERGQWESLGRPGYDWGHA